MTKRKHKGILCKLLHWKGYRIVKFLTGIMLIIMGTLLSLDIPLKEDTKINMGNPAILIAAERYGVNIDVRCFVEKEGKITFGLTAGEQMDEPVRVWFFVMNFGKAFCWETTEEIDHVVLNYSFSDGELLEEKYTLPTYFMGFRNFASQETGNTQGISREYLTNIYGEFFTVLLEPKGEERYIFFQMEPKDAEYRQQGDIIINMPWIVSWRDALANQMNLGDLLDLVERGEIRDLSFLYDCIIDDKAVFEPSIHVSSSYEGDYCIKSNYIVRKVAPDPELMEPYITWEEDVQWIPTLVFYELDYDKIIACKSWLGGILIAVGSGGVMYPLSELLETSKKRQ